MDFSRPKARRNTEPALPMINVVFLLLIFFLMSAQIVSPPPFVLTPPTAENSETATTDIWLHISAKAELAFAEVRGQEAWAALAHVENPGMAPLLVRADAELEAVELALVLARVSALGFENIQLATVTR